jgi:hypothetical protein
MTASLNSIASASKTSAWERLEQFLEGRQSARQPVDDLEGFEKELRSMFAAAEAEAVADELSRFDIDLPAIEVGGVPHRKVLRCEQTYMTAAGEVKVTRSLYSTREDGERAICPMELRAGVIEGMWTPLAAKQGTWVVTHLTPGEGEDLFTRIGTMRPSKSSLDRLPKALSERWEKDRIKYEDALLAEEKVPKNAVALAISLDGVHLPMKEEPQPEGASDNKTKKKDKDDTQGTGYHETGCASLAYYDADGERISTIRFGRMPERKKVTLKAMLAATTAHILAQKPDLRLVKVADGAKDNWAYLSDIDLPDGEQVLDFFHAAEHLSDALTSAYGKGDKRDAQYKKLRHTLRHDRKGADKVIRALVHLRDTHPRKTKLATELNYFRTHRHRMRYAWLKAKNLPIGSGVMEASCKTLVTQRMKRSGMVWGHDGVGGQAILTLRGLAQSDRFDRAWNMLAKTYVHNVTAPDNVVELSQWRRT